MHAHALHACCSVCSPAVGQRRQPQWLRRCVQPQQTAAAWAGALLLHPLAAAPARRPCAAQVAGHTNGSPAQHTLRVSHVPSQPLAQLSRCSNGTRCTPRHRQLRPQVCDCKATAVQLHRRRVALRLHVLAPLGIRLSAAAGATAAGMRGSSSRCCRAHCAAAAAPPCKLRSGRLQAARQSGVPVQRLLLPSPAAAWHCCCCWHCAAKSA